MLTCICILLFGNGFGMMLEILRMLEYDKESLVVMGLF